MTDIEALRARMREAAEKAELAGNKLCWGGVETVDREFYALASPANVKALDAEITRLREDLDRVTRERDEAKSALERVVDPKLLHLRMENGGLDMALTGEMIQHMSLLFVEWFRETGAENNIEMRFNAKTEPFECYTVTVQKAGAKTPAEQRIEATARAEAAEAALAKRDEEVARLREVGNNACDLLERFIETFGGIEEGHDSKADLNDYRATLTQEPTNAE